MKLDIVFLFLFLFLLMNLLHQTPQRRVNSSLMSFSWLIIMSIANEMQSSIHKKKYKPLFVDKQKGLNTQVLVPDKPYLTWLWVTHFV